MRKTDTVTVSVFRSFRFLAYSSKLIFCGAFQRGTVSDITNRLALYRRPHAFNVNHKIFLESRLIVSCRLMTPDTVPLATLPRGHNTIFNFWCYFVSSEYGRRMFKIRIMFWLVVENTICRTATSITVCPMNRSYTVIVSFWYSQIFTSRNRRCIRFFYRPCFIV